MHVVLVAATLQLHLWQPSQAGHKLISLSTPVIGSEASSILDGYMLFAVGHYS